MAHDNLDNDREGRRLAEVGKYALSLTVPDPFLDTVAQQMAAVCSTTTVIISLFSQPSLLLAIAGAPLPLAAKSMFCELALYLGKYVEVEDTLQHPLFKHNPVVLGSTPIRFFSSTPLMSRDGFILGSLCALNRRPTRFTPEQREQLSILGNTVMAYLEDKRTQKRQQNPDSP